MHIRRCMLGLYREPSGGPGPGGERGSRDRWDVWDFAGRHPRHTATHAVNWSGMHLIYGINSVAEALKARGRAFEYISVAKERHDLRLQRIIEECRRIGLPVRFLSRDELDRMAGNVAHQGVVAVSSAKQYSDVDDVVSGKRGAYSLILVLDGVE